MGGLPRALGVRSPNLTNQNSLPFEGAQACAADPCGLALHPCALEWLGEIPSSRISQAPGNKDDGDKDGGCECTELADVWGGTCAVDDATC